MSNHSNISNATTLSWIHQENGATFSCDRKQLGAAAGGNALGCSLFRVPAGKSAYPYHSHEINEEAVYILRGTGTLRKGDERLPVGPGDYLAHPVGSPAHQLINSGSEPLEYLCISTMIQPELGYYPDSKKLGIIAGTAPGGAKIPGRVVQFFPENADVGYWEGE